MGEQTEIAWADSTFSPWHGCTHAGGPGCDFCFAETLDHRFGVEWGNGVPRKMMSDGYWAKPLAWNRKAAKTGAPWRVFCASMCDVFEHNPDPIINGMLDGERVRLWSLIEATPAVTWMLLTKRPQNILRMAPCRWVAGSCALCGACWRCDSRDCLDNGRGPHRYNAPRWPSNVWCGTTVENQRYADLRIPQLLKVPAPVRFLSVEPLLERINFAGWVRWSCSICGPHPGSDPGWCAAGCGRDYNRMTPTLPWQWTIGGGESGPHARFCPLPWARALRDQCVVAGVPFFWKQWGEYAPSDDPSDEYHMVKVGKKAAGRLLDGVVWSEFPRG